ncbi:MAG TPA: hypothetical protein VGU25_16545 [Acidobacteriaceae bacterium]|nr:hypothetical protein [Acidobacteriaceae bacterium]
MSTRLAADGAFHIPCSFSQFHTQYPGYVREFVGRYMQRSPLQDRLEMESELNYFLLVLPAESKFRAPGTNGFRGGCKDRVMTFNPKRGHGDSAHFFGYLNHILRNRFFTLQRQARRNPITKQGTFRLSVDCEISFGRRASDEISLGEISISYAQQLSRSFGEPAQHGVVAKFIEFTRVYNPELQSLLISTASCRTFAEAQADIGWDSRSFNRGRLRLKVLYDCFTTGRPVPPQRRVYRTRKGPKL